MLFFSVSLGTRELVVSESFSLSFQCLTPVVVTPDTGPRDRTLRFFSVCVTEASSGARGRHSRSARARSETGARLTPRAMASLLRSRSALQRASSALRARVVGVRPVPAISSIVIATGVFDASAERARFPETDVRTWAPRRALTRASLPRASRGADAVASASARSPRAPRSREASSRPPRVSRRMGKQSGRASFSCRLFSDEERRRRRRARFRSFQRRPAFRPRQTHD
jgi:hypothetical protein